MLAGPGRAEVFTTSATSLGPRLLTDVTLSPWPPWNVIAPAGVAALSAAPVVTMMVRRLTGRQTLGCPRRAAGLRQLAQLLVLNQALERPQGAAQVPGQHGRGDPLGHPSAEPG